MNTPLDCDVAVVGAGLVGCALALGLQQAGWRVRLLDRGLAAEIDDDYDLRVYAISPQSARFLDELGVWPEVLATRASAYSHMQVWEQRPQDALHFDAADVRLPQLGHIVENRVLQRALLGALAPGTLRDAAAVEDCRIEDAAALLSCADGTRVRTRLVVAADSARSPLRERLGIDCLRSDYAQTAIVCHVQTERLHEGTAFQRFLDTGPLALLPLADGRSSVVWSSSEAAALLALDDAAFCAALEAATQQVLGRVLGTTRRLSFPLALQHAERYSGARHVLAGDAAHVVHPLAGQGVNLGFGDAQCLVEVLREALQARRDPGNPRVLARYARARQAAAGEMIAVTDGLYRAWQLQIPGWRWLRQQGMLAVNAAGPVRQALVRRACGID
jgi:2-polyprenylphenol 6-hydroxylase